MSCRILRNKNGEIESVKAPNGKDSKLYSEMLSFVKSIKPKPDEYVKRVLTDGLIRDLSPKEHALALWSKVHTPGFKNWFKDSKAVDENGEPLVVYHGSNAVFNELKLKEGLEGQFNPIFFTPQKEYAIYHAARKAGDADRTGTIREFADQYEGDKAIIYPGFLSVSKLAKSEDSMDNDSAMQAIVKENADGSYGLEFGEEHEGIESYAIINPYNFKSAYNVGWFDEGTSNIYYSLDQEETNAENAAKLTPILQKYGIKLQSLQHYSEVTGRQFNEAITALADPLRKVIAIANGDPNTAALPEEIGHIIIENEVGSYELTRALRYVEKTEEYDKEYDRYYARYKEDFPELDTRSLDTKVKKEILGRLLGKHIIKKIDRKGDASLIRMLKRLWQRFVNLFRDADIVELEQVLNDIADTVVTDARVDATNVLVEGDILRESESFTIKNKEGKELGKINTRVKDRRIIISDIALYYSDREIGVRAIKQLGELALENGLTLVSNTSRKGLAYELWNSMSQSGSAIKKGVRFEYIPVGVYYSLEEKNELIDELIDSLTRRIKSLRRRGEKTPRVREQRRALTKEIEGKEAGLGAFKFLKLLKSDSDEAISYLRDNVKNARVFEFLTNPQPNDILTEEEIAKAFNEANLSPKKLSQLYEFITYYEPYLKDLESYLGFKDTSLSLSRRRVLVKMIRSEQEKFRRIKAFHENVRQKMAEKIFRENYASELSLDPSAQDIDEQITNRIGFDWKSQLRHFYKDSPALEYWFGSMRDATDQILRIIHTMMARIQQTVNDRTLDFGRELIRKARSLGLANKDMKWAYETVDGKYTGYLISPWKAAMWDEARNKFHAELHEKYEYPEDFDERLDLKIELEELAFKLRNKISLSPEQAQAAEKYMRYKRDIAQWYFKNTVPISNLNEKIEEMKKILSEKEYKEWESRNIGRTFDKSGAPFLYYKNDLVRPSDGRVRTSLYDGSKVKTADYTNKDYSKLSDQQREFISHILKLKHEIDNSLPVRTHATVAPQITESFMDILYAKKGDTLRRIGLNIKEVLDIKEEDYLQGEEAERRPDGSIVRYVPIRFTSLLDNPDVISTDLLSGIIAYYEMAENFKEKVKKLPEFEIIHQQLGARVYHNQRNKRALRGDQTRSFDYLNKFLEMNLSEMRRNNVEVNILGRQVNITKLIDKFKNYVRANNLAWNVVTQATNMLSSTGFSLVEDLVGQYTTLKSKAWANKELPKHLLTIAKEVNDAVQTDKLTLLMQYTGLSGDTRSIFDNLDKAKIAKRLEDGFKYEGYIFGDFMVKSKVLMAAMHNYRKIDGKWYTEREYGGDDFYDHPSAWDMVDVVDGNLVTKIDDLEFKKLRSRIKYIADQVDGVLSPIDYAAVHQDAIFSMIAIHRNWLISGIQKRVRARGFNFMTGQEEEGHYRVVGRKTGSLIKFLYNIYAGDKKLEDFRSFVMNGWENMTPSEKIAVQRFLYDFAFAALMVSIAVMINKLADDDEEDTWGMEMAAYLGNRVAIEASSFFNPQEFITVIKDPFVPLRLVEYSLDVFDAFDTEEIERGPWEGWSRSSRFFARLIPGTKALTTLQHPEAPNQFLKTKPLKQLYNVFDDEE